MSKIVINSKDVDLAAAMADGVAAFLLFPPVFTTTVAGIRSITQVNEDEFIEKLRLFLAETDASTDAKQKFLRLLDKDAEEFFKRILKVLDSIEDKEKASMLGKLFKALLNGKMEIKNFNKLATIIQRTYLDTLKFVREFSEEVVTVSEGNKLFPDVSTDALEAQELVAIGFFVAGARHTISDRKGPSGRTLPTYHFSFLGELFYEHAF